MSFIRFATGLRLRVCAAVSVITSRTLLVLHGRGAHKQQFPSPGPGPYSMIIMLYYIRDRVRVTRDASCNGSERTQRHAQLEPLI